MTHLIVRIVFSAAGLCTFSGANATPSCAAQVGVGRAIANEVTADALSPRRALAPSFFGFNLEWLEFQLGLWDATSRRVHPDVLNSLKTFAGAVYRFPGGTNSNHISWRDAVGPLHLRPARPYVAWHPPIKAEFGPDEYLRFVQAVGGQAWYVANLHGTSTTRALDDLAEEAGALAAHMTHQASAGLPPVLRWELGNELDRGLHQWTPERLAQAAQQVGAAIRERDPKASFVLLQQEYPATKGYSSAAYNRALREGVATMQPEWAMHLYYDGVPDAPPVSHFLSSVCRVIEDAKAEGGQGRVWVTEHARVPAGFWSASGQAKWSETADLTAAISLADMLIGLAQIPEIQGAVTHSLVSSGSPWPMWHRQSTGSLEPSATFLAMSVLRQTLKPLVLASRQQGRAGGSQGAAYAVRSAVLASEDLRSFTLWSINRSEQTQLLRLQLVNAQKALKASGGLRIHAAKASTRYGVQTGRLHIDTTMPDATQTDPEHWTLVLPPNSVNAVMFD